MKHSVSASATRQHGRGAQLFRELLEVDLGVIREKDFVCRVRITPLALKWRGNDAWLAGLGSRWLARLVAADRLDRIRKGAELVLGYLLITHSRDLEKSERLLRSAVPPRREPVIRVAAAKTA